MGTALVERSEFGPFDALSDDAHQLYMDGFSEDVVDAYRAWMLVTTGGGDRATTQFLRCIEGIALQELGRHHEAVTVALDLLTSLQSRNGCTAPCAAPGLLGVGAAQATSSRNGCTAPCAAPHGGRSPPSSRSRSRSAWAARSRPTKRSRQPTPRCMPRSVPVATAS
ncbi:MAG: hypothetical protein ACYDDW_09240 [Dermatophilaceae bacterium]